MARRILPVSDNRRLRETIIQLLSDARHEPISCVTSVRKALKEMEFWDGDIGLVIVADDLPKERGSYLVEMMRGTRDSKKQYNPKTGYSHTPVIILSNGKPTKAESLPGVEVIPQEMLLDPKRRKEFLKIVGQYVTPPSRY